MLTFIFLIKTVINLYIMMFLLRIWIKFANCDFYNPFSQLIIKITEPILILLLKFFKIKFSSEVMSLILIYFLAIIKFPLLAFFEMKIFIFNIEYLFIGILSLIKISGELLFWIIIIRLLLSWISNSRSPMDIVLYQLSETIMYPIRCILPNKNNIDFSPMFIVIILYLLNYLGIYLFPNMWYKL